MSRPRHPNKHIERAIQFAESLGWEYVPSNGHAWGRIRCPHRARDGCLVSIHSTPRVPENHARHLQKEIEHCPHRGEKPKEEKPEGEQPEDEEP